MYIPGVRELPAGDIGNITLTSDWMDQQKMESVGNVRAKFQRLKQNFAMMFIYDQIQKTTKTANFIPQVKRIFRDFFYPKTFGGVDVDRSLTWHFPINLPGGTHDIDFLSSGEKEILMTFTEILKLKLTGSIILFDEPDLHLNAALERKVIGNLMQIVNAGNQIWITTHSLEIIGTVPINNLFKMYSEPSSKNNQIELCSEKIDVFDLFKNLGASVGLQLISEKIVYVEGPSDVEILRTLYQERGDKISFIETKGVNGIVGLSHAVGDLLNEASKNESFLMIRDRDFLTQDKLDEVETKYNGRVHIWSKRTIENLLLDPEILYAVFTNLSISVKDYLEMQKMIKDVANKLKLLTTSEMIESKLYQLFNRSGFGIPTIKTEDIVQEILSYVKPQRDDLVKKLQDTEIEKLIVESKKYVDDNWEADWAVICDGKKILQGLIDDYLTPKGKSMKISALRSLIVNQMKTKNKIPSEIDEFFKKHNIKIVTDLESIEQQNA
ncbi:MAG: AAA family ATPase [Thaumarchaeota archaeon]|nr:AAA family ATPase [Nitrososphaerota archaeon]